jgi:hypothetical protein
MNNWTASGLVQANNGSLAGRVIDGQNVETQRALFDMALSKEIMCGANEGFVFFLGNAQFGKPELAFNGEAGANLDERERIHVEADEVEFALGMLRHIVSGNEDIAEVPQVPVSIRFPTHACLQRLKFLLLGSARGRVGKIVARLPPHERKSDLPEHLPPSLLLEH